MSGSGSLMTVHNLEAGTNAEDELDGCKGTFRDDDNDSENIICSDQTRTTAWRITLGHSRSLFTQNRCFDSAMCFDEQQNWMIIPA